MMQAINHRWIETNGIKMHIALAGRGNFVILCHGFPECWYAWRHQIAAIAEAAKHRTLDSAGTPHSGQSIAHRVFDASSIFLLPYFKGDKPH